MKAFLTVVLGLFVVPETLGWSLNPLTWFSKSKGCLLNLNSDLNHGNEPVFLKKTSRGFELMMPQLVDEEGVIKLSKGESIYVACPGHGNEVHGFTNTGSQQSIMSKCVQEKTLSMKGKDVISTELECTKKVFTSLKQTDKVCGNYIGEEIQLGFEVEGWHPLVTLCFYRNRAETLHATHILYGSALRGAELMSHKNFYKKGPQSVYPGVNPSSAYKQANQRSVLTRLLGEARANYILARSYLSRSHLSPDADFLLGAWQHLTYFYVNTAPMWQCINGGNWLRLETAVRNFAISVKRDFVVTTGTYGILELEDSHGLPKQTFLEPLQELMPVPSLFWKIVADPVKSSCIVFVVHNNPFLAENPTPICNNVCHKNGWPTDLETVSKGFTYCCSYMDFKKVVDYAPELICQSVLENSLM